MSLFLKQLSRVEAGFADGRVIAALPELVGESHRRQPRLDSKTARCLDESDNRPTVTARPRAIFQVVRARDFF
jgi:hypothetical protein